MIIYKHINQIIFIRFLCVCAHVFVYQCPFPGMHMWKMNGDVDVLPYGTPAFSFLRQGHSLNLKLTLSTTLIIKWVTGTHLFLPSLPSSFRCMTIPDFEIGSGDPNLVPHLYPASMLPSEPCPQTNAIKCWYEKKNMGLISSVMYFFIGTFDFSNRKEGIGEKKHKYMLWEVFAFWEISDIGRQLRKANNDKLRFQVSNPTVSFIHSLANKSTSVAGCGGTCLLPQHSGAEAAGLSGIHDQSEVYTNN